MPGLTMSGNFTNLQTGSTINSDSATHNKEESFPWPTIHILYEVTQCSINNYNGLPLKWYKQD